MPKRIKHAAPIHITEWREIWIEDGIVYAAFRSGPDEHLLAMGPPKVMEGIELARRALMGGGKVVQLKAAAQH